VIGLQDPLSDRQGALKERGRAAASSLWAWSRLARLLEVGSDGKGRATSSGGLAVRLPDPSSDPLCLGTLCHRFYFGPARDGLDRTDPRPYAAHACGGCASMAGHSLLDVDPRVTIREGSKVQTFGPKDAHESRMRSGTSEPFKHHRAIPSTFVVFLLLAGQTY
jgi:hypothetical protein